MGPNARLLLSLEIMVNIRVWDGFFSKGVMPVHKVPYTTEDIRRKIDAGALAKRLADHVNGKCKMLPTQVRAAEILLKKTLPDISSVEHSFDPDANKIIVEIMRFAPTDGEFNAA